MYNVFDIWSYIIFCGITFYVTLRQKYYKVSLNKCTNNSLVTAPHTSIWKLVSDSSMGVRKSEQNISVNINDARPP